MMERLDDAFNGTNIQFTANIVGNGNGNGNSVQQQQQQQQLVDQQQQQQRNAYTIPGILHYLQHEWSRFEYDRQQWEAERAELMSKISFLQGERRGQEHLKNDLIRRIKMLELALKQERVKYFKLKNGCEPKAQDELLKQTGEAPTTGQSQQQSQQQQDEYDLNYTNIINQQANSTVSANVKNGRQLLKQYLQEIGYADTIIDIRSTRLRTLLSNSTASGQQQLKLMDNENDTGTAKSILSKKLLQPSIDSVKKFLNNDQQQINGGLNNSNNNNNNGIIDIVDVDINENVDDVVIDDETGDDDLNSTAINRYNKLANGKQQQQQQYDDDTEDALKEFSFLSNESSSSSGSLSSSGSSESLNDDWNINKDTLSKLTEQYKKERKNKFSKNQLPPQQQQQQQQQQQNDESTTTFQSQRPNRSILQAMIANLNENAAGNQYEDNNNNNNSNSGAKTQQQEQQATPTATTTATGSSQSMNFALEDDTFNTSLNLGELSRINVNSNDDTILNDSATSTQNDQQQSLQAQQDAKRSLTIKTSLRGHFDAIRCLDFHPTESLLLTGSEDQTVKLWCLEKSSNNLSSSLNNSSNSKKSLNSSNNGDVEPLYTFRGHTGAILSLLITQNGQHCLTSSTDNTIRLWNIPNDDIDPYDAYDQNVFMRSILGHTDSVWSMCLHENTLVSASSDATVRVWSNPFNENMNSVIESNVLNLNKEDGIPTSVNFIKNDTSKLICSFDSLRHVLFDLEYAKVITRIDFNVPEKTSYCFKVISNGANNTIISGHEDKRIRFYDLNTSQLIYSMVAHQDAVTDLDIDANNMYLLSSSHDCSIRLWNLDNKNCVQEITAHRKKYDESINCIAFHKTKSYIASGGADAIAKIYV